MQRLRCIQCGHYFGRYKRKTAKTVELELHCPNCKGHTRFNVVEGDLKAGRFLSKEDDSKAEEQASPC